MPPPSQACCAHDHDCDAADCGPAWSLHTHITAHRVTALNAAAPSQPAALLRAWADRASPASPPLRSDDDDPPELIVHIPFDGQVRITAIAVVGGLGGGGGADADADADGGGVDATPARLRAYVNRAAGLDFGEAAAAEPAQEWDLVAGVAGCRVEYPTRVSRFSGVHTLDLHFPTTVGGGPARLDFIGFKGTWQPARREAVITVYESKPQAADHKLPGETMGGFADVA